MAAEPTIVQAGEGEHVWGLRACITLKAATEGFSALEFLCPADFGPPLHVHHGEDELVQVLEGTVRVVCGARDEVVEPGGFAFLPRAVPHAFWVLDGPARLLVVFTPGGVEGLFVESGQPADTARLPEPGTVQAGAMDAFEESYRVETVGPPLG